MRNKAMNRRAIASCAVLLALTTVAPGLLAAPQAPPRTLAAEGSDKPSSREVVEQKLQLVKMMMTQSTAIERATNSKDPAIKQKGDNLLALYAKAYNALEAGDTAGAEKLLDEVMRQITEIARQIPDPLEIEKAQSMRYEELLESVGGIQITYKEMRDNTQPNDKHMSVINANMKRNLNLIEQAQTLGEKKRYKEAIDLLEKGYTEGVSDLNKLMGSQVSSYSLDFKTPEAEFDHEVANYKSYEDLIKVAYEQLKPNESVVKLSERFVQQSREGRDTANKQAASGDYKTAITTMQGATKHLKTALRTLGLSVPD